MANGIDPRLFAMADDQHQVEQFLKSKQPLSLEAAQKEIDTREKAIRETFKRKEKVDTEMVVPRRGLPSLPAEEDPNDYIISCRPSHGKESKTQPKEAEFEEEDTSPSSAQAAKNGEGGLPSIYECSERLKERVHLVNYQGCLYAFNGHCYDSLFSNDVVTLYRNKVDNTLGGAKTMSCINQLYQYFMTDSSIEVKEPPKNQRIAVLENGIYDVESGTLRRHSHRELVFSFVKANYVDGGKCPNFKEFLRVATRNDHILQERLWQALGYMLLQTMEAKAFFVMGMAPNSGKSLLGNFIETLFNERYVSNIALSDFNGSFSLAPIAGSAINISLDLPSTRLKASAVSKLKMLTGGDAFNVNQKYVPEFRYRNRAKLLFATNFPITLAEPDDAFWNRMVFLPFDYSVPQSEQNPSLSELFHQEKDAIVSEALRHARFLVKNNFHFPTTPSIEHRLQEWQGKRMASVENFLMDCCVLGKEYKGELVRSLYTRYEQYCDAEDIVAKSYSDVKRFLENEVGLKHVKMRDGSQNPQSAFRGIQLIKEEVS